MMMMSAEASGCSSCLVVNFDLSFSAGGRGGGVPSGDGRSSSSGRLILLLSLTGGIGLAH